MGNIPMPNYCLLTTYGHLVREEICGRIRNYMNTSILDYAIGVTDLAPGLLCHGGSVLDFMLRITTENKRGKLVLSVEGRLAGQWVAALEQCWRELLVATPRQKFSINLCGVSYIDNAGKILLKEMHGLGGELIAEGCLNQSIVKEIMGSSEKQEPAQKKQEADPKGTTIIFYIALLSLLISPGLQAQTQSPAPASSSDVQRLTLEQAVKLALKQNPTQQIAVLNTAESIQDKNITRSELLPQANLKVADSANRVNLQIGRAHV